MRIVQYDELPRNNVLGVFGTRDDHQPVLEKGSGGISDGMYSSRWVDGPGRPSFGPDSPNRKQLIYFRVERSTHKAPWTASATALRARCCTCAFKPSLEKPTGESERCDKGSVEVGDGPLGRRAVICDACLSQRFRKRRLEVGRGTSCSS